MKFSYENFIWKMRFLSFIFHMKNIIWNFLTISDLISRLKYEAMSPWDYMQFHLPFILSLNVHGDRGITWNMGLIRVRSQISETLIKLVEPQMFEFRLEWIQYPHRRRCNGWAAGMMKLGQLIPCEHVVCLAHTLHLIVADVSCGKLLLLVNAFKDPYSEEDEENHTHDVAPDLALPQQLS